MKCAFVTSYPSAASRFVGKLIFRFATKTFTWKLGFGWVVADEFVIAVLKSTAAIIPIHEAQLLTHLKLANIRLGFILNFNVPLMKQGIKRMVI